MQNSTPSPFSQFINWFELDIKLDEKTGNVYKIPPSLMEFDPEYFIEHKKEFYSLHKLTGYLSVKPDVVLLRRMITQAFKNTLKGKSFSFKGYGEYIAYWSLKPEPLPHQDIFKMYPVSFEYRVHSNFDGDEDRFYLVIDPHVVFLWTTPISGFIARGIQPSRFSSQTVRTLIEKDSKIHGIDGFLVETFQNQNGEFQCRVIKARKTVAPKGNVQAQSIAEDEEAEITVSADAVYLEPRPELIRQMLSELGTPYNVIAVQRKKSFLESKTASRDRLNRTEKIVRDYLVKEEIFPLKFGEFTVNLSPSPLLVGGVGYPRAQQVKEASLLFDNSDSSATHLQPYWGLRTFGPFSKDVPTIQLGLLGSKAGVQQLEALRKQLNSGTHIMPGGMRQFFYTQLERADQEIVSDSGGVEAYVEAAKKIGARSEERNNKIDVVLVQLDKPTSDFDLESPYYGAKPILLDHGLTSQMVTLPSLAQSQWIHANLASAIFAKAQGHPWVLAEDIEDFDMILGVALSQAISKTKRAGARPRFLGYANVFDRQGRWLFFESTHLEYDFEKHEEQLAELVKSALERYKKLRNVYPQSVAIHYYKSFGSKEIELVKQELAAVVEDYRVAFITIDKSHPMRVYDLNPNNKDGSFPRTHYAQISENEFLLSTTGHTELATKRLGTPALLKVTVRQFPIPFVELERIAEQVVALTRLNYKTLTPIVGDPVTLLFANLIAKFTAVFSEGQWKNAQASAAGKLNNVPWFL